MQLFWIILFSFSLLVACEKKSEPEELVDKENVGRREIRFRSGKRWRQRNPERVVNDDDDDSDQLRENQINSNDDDVRRSRYKSDSTKDGEDTDQAGRGRIRILSAGSFRRTGDSSLRPLNDPSLRDDDLNRIDDHNIENELNALADGLGQKHGVAVNDHDEHDNYEGLGFGDTKIPIQHSRLDTNEFSEKIMDVNTHFGPPWTEWRHCNVTCGVGKQSRWRRCWDESQGVCNRVTGREVEWRRCLGMECDQRTIEELGGGCKDQLMMSLLLGVLIGALGSVILSTIVSCLYACLKKPIDWKLSDFCPDSCANCCTRCGEGCTDCCTECWRGCCDPYTGCCAGCGGRCLCCWCQPCCDPYAQQNRLYYHKQLRMNNAYQLHHNLGPPGMPGQGPAGRMPYKRPPAPLPRESVKRKPYYDDPEYAEIDQFYQDSPRKKQKEKQNYVKFTKQTQQYDSFHEDDARPTKQKVPPQEENDYLEILGDDDVENAYLTPTMRYESDFEHLDEPPARPR